MQERSSRLGRSDRLGRTLSHSTLQAREAGWTLPRAPARWLAPESRFRLYLPGSKGCRMSDVIEGSLQASGLRFALVVARFNDFVAQRLLEGARDALIRTGASDKDITVVKVPGSFEAPMIAGRLAGSGQYDAIICVGAVVRGETPHFEYVASEAAKGIAQVAMQSGVPVAFGIVTADSMEQAIDRAGGKSGNKGFDAAMTAIEMANLVKKLGSKSKKA